MLRNLIFKFLFLIGASIAMVTPSWAQEKSNTFVIPLGGIPDSNSLADSPFSFGVAIREHIYDALFFIDTNNDVNSSVLNMSKTISTNDSFSEYDLILNQNLTFSDGSAVKANDLLFSLERLHKSSNMLLPKAIFKLIKNGIHVKLEKGDFDYFRRLISDISALIKDKKDTFGIPIGTSAYRPKKWLENEVILEGVEGKIKGDFQFIKFVNYTKNKLKIEDLDLIPLWIESEPGKTEFLKTNKYHKSIVQSSSVWSLIINWSNEVERKKLAGCLAQYRSEIAKALTSDLLIEIQDTDSIVAPGFPGYIKKFEKYHLPCNVAASTANRPRIPFYFALDDLGEKTNKDLKDLFNKIAHNLPFEVAVSPLQSIDEFVKTRGEAKPQISFVNTVAPISWAMANDGLPFYRIAFKNSAVLKGGIPGTDEAIETARLEPKLEKRATLLENAHRKILDSGYLLPLLYARFHRWYSPRIEISTIAGSDKSMRIDKAKLVGSK